MENVRNSIIEKIQALLSKTVKRGATEPEAQAAAAMAQKLLAKHNLDMAEVEALGDKGPADVIEEKYTSNTADWRGSLCSGIARSMFCKVIRTRDLEEEHIGEPWLNEYVTKLCIIGRPENVAAVRELFVWLESQVDYTGKKAGRVRGRRYANSFRQGMVSRLVDRVKQQMAEEEAHNVGMRAVVIHHDAEVKAYTREHHPKLQSAGSQIGDYGAYAAGKKAGDGVGMSSPRRQVT